MQSYISTLGLDGFENWFGIQFEEELAHARKFIKYMNDRGARVEIRGFEDPRNEFSSILEVLEVSLAHEKGVTDRINNLMTIAHEVKDYAAVSLLQWYVDEQVEEESGVQTILDQLKMVEGKGNGLFMIDKDLNQRIFVDATQKA